MKARLAVISAVLLIVAQAAFPQTPVSEGPVGKINLEPGQPLLCPRLPEINPNPKTADGLLNDWGNGLNVVPDYINYTHLYDNEAQWIENAPNVAGKLPPGNPSDDPINPALVKWGPMGNGFNLVSGLVCFDPTYKGGTYWLAWDLPGPTNSKLSDGFKNQYLFDKYGLAWYPIPFDADCNQDRDTVDELSIIDPTTIDEAEDEYYRASLYVGGDETQAPNFPSPGRHEGSVGSRYSGGGYCIFVEFSAYLKAGKPYEWHAIVSGSYTKSGLPIDLGPSGLNLVEQSSPESAAPPEYDIEVEINGVLSEIWPLIDPLKVGYPPGSPMEIWDNYHALAEFQADTDGDQSKEEWIQVGINLLTKIL